MLENIVGYCDTFVNCVKIEREAMVWMERGANEAKLTLWKTCTKREFDFIMIVKKDVFCRRHPCQMENQHLIVPQWEF